MNAPSSVQIFFDRLVARPLETLGAAAALYLPRLLAALLVLLLGRLAAGLLARLTRDLLRAGGLDVLMNRLGVTGALQRAGVGRRPSELAGLGIFWVVMVSALMVAFESLGLDSAALLLRALVAFAPRLLGAVAMGALGLVAADRVGRVVERAAAAAAVPAARLWGQLARWGVLAFAGAAVLEDLNLASQTLRVALLAVLATGPLGAAVAVGLGGREVAREVLAGQVVRAMFRPGDWVEVELASGRAVRGRIQRFDVAATLIRPAGGPASEGAAEAAGEGEALVAVPHSSLVTGRVALRPAPRPVSGGTEPQGAEPRATER